MTLGPSRMFFVLSAAAANSSHISLCQVSSAAVRRVEAQLVRGLDHVDTVRERIIGQLDVTEPHHRLLLPLHAELTGSSEKRAANRMARTP